MPTSLMRPLYDLLHLNTYLMEEALEEFDEAAANVRLLGGSRNSFKFVLGHVVWSRCRILAIVGEQKAYPWLHAFAGGATQSDGSDYPSLADLSTAYRDVSAAMMAGLDGMSDAALLEPADGVPGEQEPTTRGTLAFWVWQDCYDLGQVGSMLTSLGLTNFKELHYRRAQRLRG